MAAQDTITQDELLRRSQELFDSLVTGDKAPWQKYFAEDAIYFDEKGRTLDKAALVADISPLPTVTQARSR
ncbi:MAG: nuclear transport factor 2 family protein [Chthoniobacterales bacterium]